MRDYIKMVGSVIIATAITRKPTVGIVWPVLSIYAAPVIFRTMFSYYLLLTLIVYLFSLRSVQESIIVVLLVINVKATVKQVIV
jgi:hypothetical protein